MTKVLEITQPDDWHVHFREDRFLSATVPATAATYRRAMVMPNLQKPVTTVKEAGDYRSRILKALPPDLDFEPLMTLYLTADTRRQEIHDARDCGFINAIKLYPAGATTNSSAGIQSIEQCFPIFQIMERLDMPLSVHGEVTDPEVDIFDRERVFLDRVMAPVVNRFPELRIVIEHLSTKEAVDFVLESSPKIASTLTAHHLLLTRNDLLAGGIKPHLYCLPIVKGENDRLALLKAAVSGNPKFFLGTDSAPHPLSAKEGTAGSAGIFSAPFSLLIYADLFDSMGEIDRLEGFASCFGADFYGLPGNRERSRLVKESFEIPDRLPYGDEQVIPLKSGGRTSWRFETREAHLLR